MSLRIQKPAYAVAAFGLALILAAGEALAQGFHTPSHRAQPRHAAPQGVARHPAPIRTPQHPARGAQHPRQGHPAIVHPGNRARAQAMLRPAPRQATPIRPGRVVAPRQNRPTTTLRPATPAMAGRLPNAPAPLRSAPPSAQPNPAASRSVASVRPPSNAIGQRTATPRSQVIVETDYAAASGPPIVPSPAVRQPASTTITATQYQGRNPGQLRIPPNRINLPPVSPRPRIGMAAPAPPILGVRPPSGGMVRLPVPIRTIPPRRGPVVVAVPANMVPGPNGALAVNIVPRSRLVPRDPVQPGRGGLALDEIEDGTAATDAPSVTPADDTLGKADPQIEDQPAARQAAEDYANAFSKSGDAGKPSDPEADAPPDPMPEPSSTTGEDVSDAEGPSESTTGGSPGTSPGDGGANTPGAPEAGQPQPPGSGAGSSSGAGDDKDTNRASNSTSGGSGPPSQAAAAPPANGQSSGTTVSPGSAAPVTSGSPMGSFPAAGDGQDGGKAPAAYGPGNPVDRVAPLDPTLPPRVGGSFPQALGGAPIFPRNRNDLARLATQGAFARSRAGVAGRSPWANGAVARAPRFAALGGQGGGIPGQPTPRIAAAANLDRWEEMHPEEGPGGGPGSGGAMGGPGLNGGEGSGLGAPAQGGGAGGVQASEIPPVPRAPGVSPGAVEPAPEGAPAAANAGPSARRASGPGVTEAENAASGVSRSANQANAATGNGALQEPAGPSTPAGEPPVAKPGSTPGDARAASGVNEPGRFLTSDEFAALPKSGTIDPMKIRFSQDSIKGSFSEGGNVAQLTADLEANNVKPESISPIRIVEKEGKIFTLDNRRLKAFQDAKIPIPYTKLDSLPRNQGFKFTTKNEGTSIRVRGTGP